MMQVLQAGWNPIGDWPKFGTDQQGYFATGTADSVTYVGGMPVGLLATGFVSGGQTGEVVLTAADISAPVAIASNIIGLLYNNCLVDTRRGNPNKNALYDIHDAIPSIVPVPCYVKLWQGQSGSTDFPMAHDIADDRPPFYTDTWAIGDLLYIKSSATAAQNGRWTNAAAGNQTAPMGRVFKAPASATDSMIAMFWMVPPGITVP